MLDLDAIRNRAASRANPASPANWLIDDSTGTSHLATLASLATLTQAIHRCCDLRGDDAGNRAGLIAECSALPLDQQAEMLEHFRGEAARWARATGQA